MPLSPAFAESFKLFFGLIRELYLEEVNARHCEFRSKINDAIWRQGLHAARQLGDEVGNVVRRGDLFRCLVGSLDGGFYCVLSIVGNHGVFSCDTTVPEKILLAD